MTVTTGTHAKTPIIGERKIAACPSARFGVRARNIWFRHAGPR